MVGRCASVEGRQFHFGAVAELMEADLAVIWWPVSLMGLAAQAADPCPT